MRPRKIIGFSRAFFGDWAGWVLWFRGKLLTLKNSTTIFQKIMKKSTNRWIALGVIAVLVTGIVLYRTLWANTDDENPIAAGTSTRGVLPVQGMVIGQEPLLFALENITADIIPDEEVDLAFETSGKVTHIHFNEDTAVEQGQLLAKINDEPLQAQLKKLQAQVKLSEDRLYRQRELLERDAVSREAYEQAQTELAMLRADIDLVKANIAQTELRAPFNGVIGFRHVSEGAWVSPTTAVARIVKVVPLKLSFAISEKYMNAVRQGTMVRFTVEGFLEPFDATVYAVASEVEQGTRQLGVKAIFPNNRLQLMPGRSANVSVTLYEHPNAIVIPAEAVIKEMGVDKVYVSRGGTAQPLNIVAGQRTDAAVEVLTGLMPGDTLITTGTLQLRQGLPVKIENL
jgi:membrane fusion protein (multidrug efflux system)